MIRRERKLTLMLDVVKKTSQTLPDFNTDWILKNRERKFNTILASLENTIREAIKLLAIYDLTYVGHHILSPEERIESIRSSKTNEFSFNTNANKKTESKYFEIHKNTLLLVRLEFKFQNERIYSMIHIPFLKDHKISYGGVDYYPDIPIVEKCIHINKKSGLLTIKVTRAPLMFWRSEEHIFSDVTNTKVYKEIIVTARIHQGKKPKKSKTTPLILYYLVNGFHDTLAKLKFQPGELSFSETCDRTDDKNLYFEVKIKDQDIHLRSIYIKVSKTIINDLSKRRFVGGLLYALNSFKRPYTIRDLEDPEATVWVLILGMYVYVNKELIDSPDVVIEHVRDHLVTNETLVDGVTKNAFRSLGLEIRDFNDFLLQIYEKIHEWYSDFNPADLYNKRISYTALFSNFERKLYGDIYKILKSIKQKKKSMEMEHAKKFRYNKAHHETWWNQGFFMANPILCNSNLAALLLHRVIIADSDESGGKRKGKQAPKEMQLADPSQLTVTAITTVPSSTPIISGSINPYVSTDIGDNIIVADELREYVKDCFVK